MLDARRFPTIDFRGRYAGTLEWGTLSGDLHVRGAPRRVSMGVRVSREGGRLVAAGLLGRAPVALAADAPQTRPAATRPVRPHASSRSVCRARNAGTCRISHTCATAAVWWHS